MQLVTHLWFAEEAKEAAEFYVSLLPDSRIERVTNSPADTPNRPAGSVEIVEFTLTGQPFMAISAGKQDAFNHAMSLLIRCENQAEIDRLWSSLLEGGSPEPCGWLTDRYGVSWQITWVALSDMLADQDRQKAKQAMEAMLKMEKIDIKSLQNAFDGSVAVESDLVRAT